MRTVAKKAAQAAKQAAKEAAAGPAAAASQPPVQGARTKKDVQEEEHARTMTEGGPASGLATGKRANEIPPDETESDDEVPDVPAKAGPSAGPVPAPVPMTSPAKPPAAAKEPVGRAGKE